MHVKNYMEALYISFKKKSVYFSTASHLGKKLNLEWIKQTQDFFLWGLSGTLIQFKNTILRQMKAVNPELSIFIQNSNLCIFFTISSLKVN